MFKVCPVSAYENSEVISGHTLCVFFVGCSYLYLTWRIGSKTKDVGGLNSLGMMAIPLTFYGILRQIEITP